MTEHELDAMLSAKVKGCVAQRSLPDDFGDRLRCSVQHSRRAFTARLAAVVGVVVATATLTVGLVGRKSAPPPADTSISAVEDAGKEANVSGWMLLSMFRDIFRKNKTLKRKEEDAH